MKKLGILLMLIPLLISCTGKGDEIWELYIGQSRESVAKKLKKSNYEIENFSEDSYLTIKEKIKFHGIEWNEITCWFNENNELKEVEFSAFHFPTTSQLETLTKYLKEEGYPNLKEYHTKKEKDREDVYFNDLLANDELYESGVFVSEKPPMKVILHISIYGETYGKLIGTVNLIYCKENPKK